ncbi:LpqN/LpqT family lipoprotein [Williamsia soli]|uniref:LpqN/LpqT family lipoprotein n=1 Tax=Williamsia soli TaxID=364929 RepID=UPI001A9F827B|nr:LpqN/LpqT family lipoprotein [Williamsia soli]
MEFQSTIADHIRDNNVKETPIKMGDPDAPTIDLPIPEGWSPAGELKNLPSAQIVDEREATLSGFPANEIAATYDLEGTEALSAQQTVIITTCSGETCILQLNGTSDQAQVEILGDAANAIDTVTIEP